MASIWGLFIILLVAGLFWRHRQQAECARRLIERHCKELELQLLTIHYAGINWPMLVQRKLDWIYRFEFTSVPNRRFNGYLHLYSRRYEFDMPAYPFPDESSDHCVADSRPQIKE
ncbi:MAG: hypothetical protein CENE_00455 [Candidatus Celerinatantimonas neptuna]|nr:MAG: hypothetical protein CENE_00455 [Candidatus Celerinatantimonas neptuna]